MSVIINRKSNKINVGLTGGEHDHTTIYHISLNSRCGKIIYQGSLSCGNNSICLQRSICTSVYTASIIPYFLEILPHLEILPPSKCCHIYLLTRPNAALEISPHGKGSTAIYIYACTFCMHTNRLIMEAVYRHVCQSL